MGGEGLNILREQSDEQVLSDEAHFERSPMYHALVLEIYLDVLNVLPESHGDRGWLAERALRMSEFLVSVTHPDGGLSLFNDSALEIAPKTHRLLDYARLILNCVQIRKRDSFPEAGYFVAEHEDAWIIIDGGALGPNYLLAHAHADIFSYELSLQSRRLIVDTGVFNYEPGPFRDYVRSSRAHNTVSVDRVDQAECWHRFRVARRFEPRDVVFKREGSSYTFEGRFDGYATLIGDDIQHHRRLRFDWGEREIQIRDRVDGRGCHLVESFVHLHPEVTVEGRGRLLELRRDNLRVKVQIAEGQWALRDSVYCPEFGTKTSSKKIVLSSSDPLPAQISYSINY